MDSEAVRLPPPPINPVDGAAVFAEVGVVTELLLPASTVKLRATLKGSAFFFGFGTDSVKCDHRQMYCILLAQIALVNFTNFKYSAHWI